MKLITKDYTLELTVNEWNELLAKTSPINDTQSDNSHKSFTVKGNYKIPLDQIKRIKELSLAGKNGLEISKILNINQNAVYYWIKNTPKELVM